MKKILTALLGTLIISACSASYEKLKNIETSKEKTLKNNLLIAYKEKAKYEAEEMHDWNSAKLYSEKALNALDGKTIKPQKIEYWKLPASKAKKLTKSYNDLMTVYDEAKVIDPYNLAVAISSLDCWAEQQEENWQTNHIQKCKNYFFKSMHTLYENILEKNENYPEDQIQQNLINNSESAIVVTENKNNEILQIIYFDFDEAKLSNVSLEKLNNFLNKYKKKINNYIVVGHSDRKGTNKYNLKLSLKRAEAVKKILVSEGIHKNKIKVLGKGELFPAVPTKNEVAHPANRRVEISSN